MENTSEHLVNDLKVVFCPSNISPVVAFQIWVGVGSADEQKNEAGLAHVLEHMLFKGTTQRKVGDIPKDIEKAGGTINAWTSHDETVYHVTMASQFAFKGLDVLADLVQNAALDNDELVKELDVILEEIRMDKDNPGRMAAENLFSKVYTKHPYGKPIIGLASSVKSFDREIVHNFYKRFYNLNNMVLVVSGDFNEQTMLSKIDQLFCKKMQQDLPARDMRVIEPPQKSIRKISVVSPIQEANLAIGFPIPGLMHEDVAALDLLAAILGQGSSSRLETEVRRHSKLAGSISAVSYTPKDCGIFCIFANCKPTQIEAVCKAVTKAVVRLANETVGRKELEKVKNMLLSENVYAEETVDGRAKKLGFYGLHAKDLSFDDKYRAKIIMARPSSLQQVAQKYFACDKITLSTIIPNPNALKYDKKVRWVETSKKPKNKETTASSATVNKQVFEKTMVRAIQGAWQKAASVKNKKRTKGTQTIVHTLSSGDTLLISPDSKSEVAAVRIAYLGGARHESVKRAGISTLLSTLLTFGTQNKTAMEVAEAMDDQACSIRGFSGRNTFGIMGSFLTNRFEQGFELMADCLLEPALSDEDVSREKNMLIDEIRSSLDNLGMQAFLAFQKALFGTHPYGRPVYGNEASILALSPKNLKTHLAKITQASPMTMSVVGGVDPDEVIKLVEKYFARRAIEKGNFRDAIAWKGPKKSKQTALVLKKKQSHLVMGFAGTTLDNEDRFALEVLIELLGGHGGRLFNSIREQKGLAYSVTATSMEGVDPGYVALYAATMPGQESILVHAMKDEIALICNKRPSQNDVTRIKQYLIGTRAISLQRAGARATSQALNHLYGLGYDADIQYAKKISAVTPKLVQEMANHYFKIEKMVISCVGPTADKLDQL